MERNIDFKIINLLSRHSKHIREIAKELGINHTSVLRKINELFKENVVDYNLEGKNKVYFLKKNLETKNYLFAMENYNLISLIKKYPGLRKIIEKIQNNKKISLAIIFGSYAKYIANLNSDVDIFLETTDKELKKEISLIDTKISIKIGKFDTENLLIKEIEKNHVIIKGVEKYYEKNKFFS